tara:strand:+ start:329 stop:517 length:189 start_codon:yes stop_codon:yes gene_type:complete
LAGRLEGLSPLAVLARGYSLTRKEGAVVREADSLAVGDEIETHLAQGSIKSRVLEIKSEPQP